MATYRINLRYDNPRCESSSLVRANDMVEAESMCVAMMRLEAERMAALESKNIFVSKRLVECYAIEDSEDEVKLVDNHRDLILPAGDVKLLPSGPQLGES